MRADRSLIPIAAAISVLLAAPLPLLAQHVNPANGHTYFESRVPVTFAEGRALAALVGGTLATITSAEERDWLAAHVGFAFGRWIGLTDEATEGDFLWETGEPLVYTDWGPGEPYGLDHVVSFGPVAPLGAQGWNTRWPDEKHGAWIECELPLLPEVANFAREQFGETTHLTWQQGAYDLIRVYREFQLHALLPGGAAEYLVDDSAAPSDGYRYTVIAEAGGVLTSPATTVVRDISVGEAQGAPGEIVNIAVTIDNFGGHVLGWAYGVCNDPSAIHPIALGPGATATLQNGQPVDFNDMNLYPDGFDQGVLISFEGYGSIPWGSTGVVAATADYLIDASAPLGAQELALCGTLGNPPYYPQLVQGGSAFPPDRADPGAIHVTPPRFLRGDANGDGAIDIADPIALREWLFGLGSEIPCLEAGEANGDAQLDLADIIYLLMYLFTQGQPPTPGPFPACGVDPELSTTLGCAEGSPCP